jgi:O-antigen ligase
LVIAVALIVGGRRFLGQKAVALLQFGSKSSVSQRYGYWSAAIHLWLHHPVVGTGPDTFAVTYTPYQSATLAKTLGSTFYVNGAHNIFLSWLANEGIPGLVVIVALFVVAVVWGVRTWRALRVGSSDAGTSVDPGLVPSEVRRYLVVALVAAVVGYFVQASFDVEQVGTLFALFMVLGLLGTANRGVWSVARLVRLPFGGLHPEPDVPTAEEDDEYGIRVTSAGVYGRTASQARGDLRRVTVAVAVGAVGLTAVGLTFWRTDAMWRADHDAWTRTQTSVMQAVKLNPWEPSYFYTLGESAGLSYNQNPKASDGLQLIQTAIGYLRQAVALDPYDSTYQAQLGAALQTEAGLEDSKAVYRMALASLHHAQRDNPFNTEVDPVIKKVEKSLGSS